MPGHDILIRNGLVFGSAGRSAVLNAIENSSAVKEHASACVPGTQRVLCGRHWFYATRKRRRRMMIEAKLNAAVMIT